MGDNPGQGGFSSGGIHMSMDDIFSQFGDIFGGSPFESIFGGLFLAIFIVAMYNFVIIFKVIEVSSTKLYVQSIKYNIKS